MLVSWSWEWASCTIFSRAVVDHSALRKLFEFPLLRLYRLCCAVRSQVHPHTHLTGCMCVERFLIAGPNKGSCSGRIQTHLVWGHQEYRRRLLCGLVDLTQSVSRQSRRGRSSLRWEDAVRPLYIDSHCVLNVIVRFHVIATYVERFQLRLPKRSYG